MEIIHRNAVANLIRRAARRHPDKVALIFGDRQWTYRRLDEAGNRLARHLIDAGLKKGERVAAFGRNSDAYVLLWLATAKAGLVHVPVNFTLAGEELSYILNQSGSRALFHDPDLADRVDAVKERHRCRNLRHAPGTAGNSTCSSGRRRRCPAPEAEVRDTDLVQLLYTSGTTSAPKGAMMTHRALVHEYISCITALDFSPADRPLHALPLYHSAQMHVFLMPYLMLGATNRLLEVPECRGRCSGSSQEERIDSFAPDVLDRPPQPPRFPPARFEQPDKGYYGASIMPVPVLKKLKQALPQLSVYNCFGQSEIAPLATVLRPGGARSSPRFGGKTGPLRGDARGRRQHGRRLTRGNRRGGLPLPAVVHRLLGQAGGDGGSLSGGWFHSGDLARIDEEGYITIVDRKKDVINTGGVLVASREVEDAIYSHPAVKEVWPSSPRPIPNGSKR